MQLSHSEKYGRIIAHLGEDTLRRLIPVQDPAKLRTLLAADPHLNNVPLFQWDARHESVLYLVRAKGGTKALAPIIGPGGWSLCDSVCTLKETARRLADA